MPIHVYVSPDATTPFGDSWEYVGTLDSSRPSINQQAANTPQKNPVGNATLSAELYLSGDPESRSVKARMNARASIAFDQFGDRSRVLVAKESATVTPLQNRPPELHPSAVDRPVMIPVKVSGGVTRI